MPPATVYLFPLSCCIEIIHQTFGSSLVFKSKQLYNYVHTDIFRSVTLMALEFQLQCKHNWVHPRTCGITGGDTKRSANQKWYWIFCSTETQQCIICNLYKIKLGISNTPIHKYGAVSIIWRDINSKKIVESGTFTITMHLTTNPSSCAHLAISQRFSNCRAVTPPPTRKAGRGEGTSYLYQTHIYFEWNMGAT
jgi:hypothetical protein